MEYLNSQLYNNLRLVEQQSKTRIIFDELGDHKTLDVGCGTGISSEPFSDVIGIDPAIDLLKANKKPHILGNAEDLPFEDNSFEQIISVSAIHNFDNAEKAITEMKRVCKPEGKIAISILNASSKKEELSNLIKSMLEVYKIIDEGIDTIYLSLNQ